MIDKSQRNIGIRILLRIVVIRLPQDSGLLNQSYSQTHLHRACTAQHSTAQPANNKLKDRIPLSHSESFNKKNQSSQKSYAIIHLLIWWCPSSKFEEQHLTDIQLLPISPICFNFFLNCYFCWEIMRFSSTMGSQICNNLLKETWEIRHC